MPTQVVSRLRGLWRRLGHAPAFLLRSFDTSRRLLHRGGSWDQSSVRDKCGRLNQADSFAAPNGARCFIRSIAINVARRRWNCLDRIRLHTRFRPAGGAP